MQPVISLCLGLLVSALFCSMAESQHCDNNGVTYPDGQFYKDETRCYKCTCRSESFDCKKFWCAELEECPYEGFRIGRFEDCCWQCV